MFWQTTCNAFWHICWHFENMQYFLAVSAIYSDMFSDKYSGTPSAILTCNLRYLPNSSDIFRHTFKKITWEYQRISNMYSDTFLHYTTFIRAWLMNLTFAGPRILMNFGQGGLGPLSSGHDPNRSRLQRNLATFARQMGNIIKHSSNFKPRMPNWELKVAWPDISLSLKLHNLIQDNIPKLSWGRAQA